MSKFGGIPVSTKPSASKFGGLPVEQDTSLLGRGIERVGTAARGYAQGVASIPDLITLPGRYIAQKVLGESKQSPYNMFNPIEPSTTQAIDTLTNNKLVPKDMLDRYISTAGNFMVGGGPVKAAIGGAVGSQTASELGGGIGSQIAGSLLGARVAGGVMPNMSAAEKKVVNNIKDVKTPYLGSEVAPGSNLEKITVRAMERTPETQDIATQGIKDIEKNAVKNIEPVKFSSQGKVGAESINKNIRMERAATSDPMYKSALTNKQGKYIRPSATPEVNQSMLDLESNPNFSAYKKEVLTDPANAKELENGYANSAAMYDDIHNRISADARSSLDPIQKRSLKALANQVDPIKKSIPAQNAKMLAKADANYQKFSKELDSIFGEDKKGFVGKLLSYDKSDIKSQEEIVKQMKNIFESQPERIQQIKNTFSKYGMANKLDNAFLGYSKEKIQSLPKNQTLFENLMRTPKAMEKFKTALPDKYKQHAMDLFKISENLERAKNKAFYGSKGLNKQDVVDFAGAAGGQYAQRAQAKEAYKWYNKVRGVHDIDKEVVSIIFDPQRSKDFMDKYSKLSTIGAKQEFVAKYLAKSLIANNSNQEN